MEGLIQNRLLRVHDQIEFVFKGYRIYGNVGHGGHIGCTVIVTPRGETVHTLQQHTYPSLTSWSEACLREGTGEENLRYASWKRVIHTPSQRTLQSLRSEYNVNTKAAQASRQDLFAEINRLHRRVKEMTRVVEIPETPLMTYSIDNLLEESAAIEFFKKWNGT